MVRYGSLLKAQDNRAMKHCPCVAIVYLLIMSSVLRTFGRPMGSLNILPTQYLVSHLIPYALSVAQSATAGFGGGNTSGLPISEAFSGLADSNVVSYYQSLIANNALITAVNQLNGGIMGSIMPLPTM